MSNYLTDDSEPSRKWICSLEFFPPKNPEAREPFYATAQETLDMDMDFVSITYGAGGKSREFTREFADWLNEHLPIPVMPHLTCVGHSREELREIIRDFMSCGFQSIMALRGDTPRGMDSFPVRADGFRYGNELVAFIRQEYPQMKIGVAGYPEMHPESTSLESDIENLKRKVDAGGNLVVTQLFFNNEDFFRYRDACRSAGIDVPIHAGILPPVHLEQLDRFCSFCGASIPKALREQLESASGRPGGQIEAGVDWTAQQVDELIENDVEGIHFYMLNKPDTMRAIKKKLPLLVEKPVLAAKI